MVFVMIHCTGKFVTVKFFLFVLVMYINPCTTFQPTVGQIYDTILFLQKFLLWANTVTKFEVANIRVHCTDDLAENFVTECLLKVDPLFLDQYNMGNRTQETERCLGQ